MSDKRSNTNLYSPDDTSSGCSTPVESEVRRPHVLDVPDKPNSALHRGTARLFNIDAAAALGAAAIVGTDNDKDPFVTAPTENTSLNGPPAEGPFDLTELDIETLMKLKVDEVGAKTTFSVQDLNRLDVAQLMNVDVGAPSLDHGERHIKLTDGSIERLIAMDIQTLADVTVVASLSELADQQIDLTSLSLETLLTADAGPVTSTDDVSTIEVAQLDLDTLTTVDAGTADTSGDAVTSEGGETGGGLEFAGDTNVDTTSTVQVASSDSSFVPASFGSTSSVDSGDAAPPAPSNSSVGAVSDGDAAANVTSESSVIGATAGVAALATDPDGGDTVTYSLTDDAGGRFAIDTNTGVITVADPLLLDYETTTNHTVTVQATSTDGSTSNAAFIINLSDDTGEFAVTAVSDSNGTGDTVSESASVGAPVNITALATDGDGSDTVTYSLTNDAGGRFAIDANTGVISVADPMLLDFETATNHTVTVQATSTDGSTAVQNFTVNLVDDTGEFSVGAISDNDGAGDVVSESAANGTAVGIAALATDADGSDTVTYSLTNDAGGRFTIDSSTGVISVADFLLLDYETATSHNVTVRATSTDGSTSDQVFAIGVSDDTTEFSVSAVSDTDAAADSVGESVANGTVVGVTALATDADGTDTVSYSLTDDAGRTVRDQRHDRRGDGRRCQPAGPRDRDEPQRPTVRATSTDGSTSDQVFAIGVSDDTTEFSVGAVTDVDVVGFVNAVSESAANGTTVGITASATDADGSDTVTYSLTDDAGGRFAIDANTGVVTVADASLLDFETAAGHTIEVTATSSDGSTSNQTFAINVVDANEAPTDLTLAVNSGISLNTDGGNNAYLHTVNGGAIVGGLSQLTIEMEFSGTNVTGGDVPLFSYHAGGASDEIELGINETGGLYELYIEIGEQAHSVAGYDASVLMDGADHQISLTWDNAAGDWQIFVDGTLVANGTGIAAGDTIAGGGTIVLGQEQDTLGGGFDPAQVFHGTLYDVRVFNDVRSSTEISENLFSQVDASEPGLVANWRMDDLSGGVTTDSVGGNDLSVANVTGGGWVASTQTLVAAVPEGAPDGRLVGSVSTTDQDAGDTFTYSLTDDAGGRFAIDGATGAITVADGSLLDYETAASHDITIRVTDGGGLTYDETFTINVANLEEANVVTGTAGDDVLTGTANDESLFGLAGNDTISGLGGADSLYGGDGDDTLDGGAGADILDGGAGYDIVDYSSALSRVDIRLDLNQGFFDDAAGDTYSGIEGAIGGAGGDHIYGQFGSAVDNQFNGGAGDDALYGFEGNDTLIGGAGADVLDGGAGTDTVSYAVGSGNAVTVNLSTGLGSGNDAQGDTYTDIENVIGSNNDDVLTGDANANVINGGDGNDTIEGLGGGDTLTGGTGNDTFVYVGAGTDSDTITDFTQGDDRIDVSSYGLTDINDLTIADDGFGNAMIFLPSGDDVTLTGVAPVALTDSDFIF